MSHVPSYAPNVALKRIYADRCRKNLHKLPSRHKNRPENGLYTIATTPNINAYETGFETNAIDKKMSRRLADFPIGGNSYVPEAQLYKREKC